MTVGEAIRAAAERLAATSDTARLDAELLMAHALGMRRSDMLLNAMRDPAPGGFCALVERRAGHEPVAYITGEAEFYGLTLNVTPATLIPRHDSETLIAAAREAFADRPAPQRILDLGTGPGTLLLAALSLFPGASGVGVEASSAALALARENGARLCPGRDVTWAQADWRAQGWRDHLGTFDLILCNPPYVETTAALDRQVAAFEPAGALFAGPEGLDDYRVLVPQVPALLAPAGVAVFEIGPTQAEAVSAIAAASGLSAALHRDLADRPRALVMRSIAG